MPRMGPGWRYDEPVFGFGAGDRDLDPNRGYSRNQGHARPSGRDWGRPMLQDRGFGGYDHGYPGGGGAVHGGPGGYDRGYAGGGRGSSGGYDRGFRGGYDRHAGGFGAGNLYNRIMHGYGRDYAPREHGSRPAGPTHNWGQGNLSRGGGRGYDSTWFY